MSVDSLEKALHHGWPEVEAEVASCKYVPNHGTRLSGTIAFYLVVFSYEVNGIIYHGGTSSSVAVERHDKFPIRYNPEHPDQNNSLASMCDRPWFNDYLYVVAALILGATLYGFVNAYLLHR